MDSTNRNMNAFIFLSVMALLFSAGCLNLKQPALKVDYYQIEPKPVKRSKPEPLNIVLGVRYFDAAAAFDSDRIVFKEGQNEWQMYFYHRWITNATEMVRDALLKDLQLSDNYLAVVPVPGAIPWDYEIGGYVQGIYENDLGSGGWESVINLYITFIKSPPETAQRKVLFQENYHAAVPCKGRDPKAVVAAMSTAMQQIIAKLQQDIDRVVVEEEKREEAEAKAEAEAQARAKARAKAKAEAEAKAEAMAEAEEAEKPENDSVEE